MTPRQIGSALMVGCLSVCVAASWATPADAIPHADGPATSTDNEPTIAKILDLLAGRKRLATLNPSKVGEQIPWLRLREEGKTDSSLVLGLSRPSGFLKKAVFSFSATENGKGWELLGLSFTCAGDVAEISSQMRKRLGKPRATRKTAVHWQFRDGWGVSLTAGGPGEVEIAGNPNEDVAD